MPLFSSFAPFGMMTFSSQPTYSEKIYDSFRKSQGNEDGAFREFGYQGAKLYATAMMFGRIQELYRRIVEQHSPDTVTFYLDEKEQEYRITPDTSRSDSSRRDRLKSRFISGIGCSEADLDAGLLSVLGTSFQDLVLPSDSSFADLVDNFPTSPPLYANYQDSTIAGKWLVAEHNWGPASGNLTARLICGDPPVADEIYAFGSSNETTTQSLTTQSVISLGDDLYEIEFAAPITKPVEQGQAFTSSSYPIWSTGRRRFVIKISADASKNNNLMTDTDNYMDRSVRAVTVWEKSIPQVGGFVLNSSPLNYTLFNLWLTIHELEFSGRGLLIQRWMTLKWRNSMIKDRKRLMGMTEELGHQQRKLRLQERKELGHSI